MVNLPFTILPIKVQNEKLPILEYDNIKFHGDLEYLSLEHWVLGDNQDSLQGLVNGTKLTPMGAIPDYKNNHITFSAAKGEALETELTFGFEGTICIVYKSSGTIQNRSIFTAGALNPEGTGLIMWHGASKKALVDIQGVGPSRQVSQPIITEEWQFLALSVQKTKTLIADGDNVEIGEITGGPKVSNRNIAIGSSYQEFTDDVDLNVAEFIIFSDGLNEKMLLDVYKRSKNRMKERGISI